MEDVLLSEARMDMPSLGLLGNLVELEPDVVDISSCFDRWIPPAVSILLAPVVGVMDADDSHPPGR
jgi:hypothetical protein